MDLRSKKRRQREAADIINAGKRREETAARNIIDYTRQAKDSISPELEQLLAYEVVVDGAKRIDTATATSGGKVKTIIQKIREKVLPILVSRDRNLSLAIRDEYNLTWYESAWYSVNGVGLDLRFAHPVVSARDEAWFSPLSKLGQKNPDAMATDRLATIRRLETAVNEAVETGTSVRQLSKEIDTIFGLRTNDGRVVNTWQAIARNGEIYRSVRVARTEMGSIRGIAQRDAMLKAQALGLDERLQKVSVLDDRTRAQSASMDGQISNKKGEFLYPDGRYYVMGMQPKQWRINDRGTTVARIEGVDDDLERRQRDIETGKNEVVSYRTFDEYAKEKKLKVNRYGQRVAL